MAGVPKNVLGNVLDKFKNPNGNTVSVLTGSDLQSTAKIVKPPVLRSVSAKPSEPKQSIRKKEDSPVPKPAAKYKVVYARVSPEFKKTVAIYCAQNQTTEKELILKAVTHAIGLNGRTAKGLQGKKFINFKTDISLPTVSGRFPDEFKKAIKLFCIEKDFSENELVAQSIADFIGSN